MAKYSIVRKGFVSVTELEKQMYMTKDEIIKRVEWMTKSSVELSQPVLVYNDGFKDGANFVLQNLQQTQCTARLQKIQQMIDDLEIESERYPKMRTTDVILMLNKVAEVAAIA